MPTTRSGLQRGSEPSKPSKRKRSNTDARDIDEEEENQKTKGGRGGKKAKVMKKKKHLRFVLMPSYLRYGILTNFTGKQAWTKHEKMQRQRKSLKHTSK